MYIDLAYSMTNESNPDFDNELLELLGIPDHQGWGFGLRDMQWEDYISNLSPHDILKHVKQITGGHLAYISVSLSDDGSGDPVIQYEASWFQANPADPIPRSQGH